MMKKVIRDLTICCFVLFTSCEEEVDFDNPCKVKDPVEELEWLKQEIDKLKDSRYSTYAIAEYNGEIVFIYGNCNPAADYFPAVYNCSGELLGSTHDFGDEISNVKLLWKHEESLCSFGD